MERHFSTPGRSNRRISMPFQHCGRDRPETCLSQWHLSFFWYLLRWFLIFSMVFMIRLIPFLLLYPLVYYLLNMLSSGRHFLTLLRLFSLELRLLILSVE